MGKKTKTASPHHPFRNRRSSIQTSLVLIGISSILLVAIVLILVNVYQMNALNAQVEQEIQELYAMDLNHITQGLSSQIASQDQSMRRRLVADIKLTEYLINQQGGISLLEEQTGVTATNQLTGESITVSMPLMAIGEQPVILNDDPNQNEPIVDDVKNISGNVVAIFQIMNRQGDLIRVSTNIINNGKRAVGTYIPAKDQGGVDNPVVKSIMDGKDYTGVAYVVNTWYLSVYRPIKDDTGKVIGALFVGIKQENDATLRNTIQNLKVGNDGYAFILGGSGDRKGKYIISQNAGTDGKSILGELSADGYDIGEEIVGRATNLKLDETATFEYTLPSTGEKQHLQLAYYAPWDWVIGVTIPSSELQETANIFSEKKQTSIFTGILIGLLATIISGMVFMIFARGLTKPIAQLNKNVETLASGNLKVNMIVESKNEIGELSQSLDKSISYLQSMAEEAQKIATGDLTSKITPRSEDDILAQSFLSMSNRLKQQMSLIKQNADLLDQSAVTLSLNAAHAAQATNQISTTIQQIAHGASQQTDSITRTAGGVDQLIRAIDGVARGAQEQAAAAAKAAEITHEISNAIQQVTQRVTQSANISKDASSAAESGSAIVGKNLDGMLLIREKVDITDQKMKQMEDRSNQIGDIVQTIEDIASQTNLLALNAAIEAARAEAQASELIETLLNRQMLSQAQLVNQLLAENEKRPEGFWSELSQKTGLDVISVANEDGMNIYSSDSRLIGFRYSEDPKEQSFAFRKIIHEKGGYVCQPPRKRTIDNTLYKYVGVTRRDKPGVIQVGFNAESLSNFNLRVGGFAVVANEVYRLAENSKSSAKDISSLIRDIRKSMNEAVKAMQESANEVDQGYKLAEEANLALQQIIKASEEVTRQSEEAAKAADSMNEFADQLVLAVDSVSAVVEENTAATEEMAASSGEVNQAIENIASVSEENSASVEEVSASTEEMKAQVDLARQSADSLKEMSERINAIVSEFRISDGINSDGE